MSNPVKEEFRRFIKLFISHGKVVVGGMVLSGMFLFFYTGIRELITYLSRAISDK